MSNRPLIAIDVDEVLFPLQQTFLAHHNEFFGTRIEYPDKLGRYVLEEFIPDLEEIEFERRFKDYIKNSYFIDQEPISGSIEAVRRLSQKYDLTVVTSRQDYLEKPTRDFLAKYYGDSFKSAHFTEHEFGKGMKIPKSEICKRIGANYMIDDNVITTIDCARTGLKAVLFGDYLWNQEDILPTGVMRCNDWQAVLEYFDA